MIIRDGSSFDDIDWALGQSTTTTIVAPGAPGSGIQSIPTVSLGPVQVMGRNGATIPQVIGTIRTPSKIVSTVAAPSGLFQATIDQADLDAGAVVIFSGSGYLSTTVQAIGLLCNRGTRNELGQSVTMSTNQCSFPVYYLDPVQMTIPQGGYPPTYAPPSPAAYGVPYGGPGYAQPMYPPPPPGYVPSPYGPPTTPEGYYRSSDIPVEERPGRRVQRRTRPMKSEEEAAPAAAPAAAAPSAAPAPGAPGIFALGDGTNPWLIGGGVVLAVGFLIWVVKS